MNKIVVFSNIKGGVGKTQMCATMATYAVEQGLPVIVIDADMQQSLSRHRDRDLKARPNTELPWKVQYVDIDNIDEVKNVIERAKQLPCIVMIDCPGNVSDPALKIIFDAADVAILPLEYNSDVVDATELFGVTLKKRYDELSAITKKKKRIFLVPNKVSAVYEQRGEVRRAREYTFETLVQQRKIGYLTKDIKLTTHMNGYSTVDPLTYEKRLAVRDAFDKILESLK